MVFKTVRGMRDLLPEDAERMRNVEKVSREISKLYGYSEIITPVLEPYDLLAAKTSEEIRERMYIFNDLGNRKVAMRPEFTASVARLVVNICDCGYCQSLIPQELVNALTNVEKFKYMF